MFPDEVRGLFGVGRGGEFLGLDQQGIMIQGVGGAVMKRGVKRLGGLALGGAVGREPVPEGGRDVGQVHHRRDQPRPQARPPSPLP